MELLDQYLSAVARHAPTKERVRIVKLVRTKIEILMEQDIRQVTTEQKLTDALIQLGPPNRVVNRFLQTPRYLIGPAVYDAYWQSLSLVFWAVVISLLIANGVEFLFNGPMSLMTLLFTYLTNLASALAQSFFWITLVFIVFERRGIRIDLHTQFQPNHLPPVDKWGEDIPGLEPKIGLILTTISFVIFYFAPQIIGLYYFENGDWQIISIFNLKALPYFLPLFLLFFASSSAREIAKLMSGQWNYPVLIVTIFCNFLTVGIVGLIVSEARLWNPTFVQQFQIIFQAEAPLLANWQNLQRVVIISLAAIAMIDTIVNSIRVWELHQAPPFLSNENRKKKVGKDYEQK
ncbi:MAG: hypothetical protein ACRC5Q_04050 [Culicoidibacterales bacterium]